MDFDALVLGACMDTFAVDISVLPLQSQPSVAPYAARGVWTVRNVDIAVEGEGILSGQNRVLGVRLSEFAVVPVPGDRVTVQGNPYLIDDVDEDGQGGAEWALKMVERPSF